MSDFINSLGMAGKMGFYGSLIMSVFCAIAFYAMHATSKDVNEKSDKK